MKVLDIGCANGHRFEGWFASDDEFQAQEHRAEIQCPICGDSRIARLPSAPRLNVSRGRAEPDSADEARTRQQSQWLEAVRHMMATTEDVGERFPEEARRIHYGEAEGRGIRGRASSVEAEALREEGIEVVAVPVPESLKGPLQ